MAQVVDLTREDTSAPASPTPVPDHRRIVTVGLDVELGDQDRGIRKVAAMRAGCRESMTVVRMVQSADAGSGTIGVVRNRLRAVCGVLCYAWRALDHLRVAANSARKSIEVLKDDADRTAAALQELEQCLRSVNRRLSAIEGLGAAVAGSAAEPRKRARLSMPTVDPKASGAVFSFVFTSLTNFTDAAVLPRLCAFERFPFAGEAFWRD